jgi:hypothetical protein
MAILVLLAITTVGLAGDDEYSRPTLRGLGGIRVTVADLDPKAKDFGLDTAVIQTDVELKLRQAGIKVVTRAESFKVPGMPELYINVMVLRSAAGFYAYYVEVELQQGTRLYRDPKVDSFAATWSSGGLGALGTADPRAVRDHIKDQVDQFINAYLSVNPK